MHPDSVPQISLLSAPSTRFDYRHKGPHFAVLPLGLENLTAALLARGLACQQGQAFVLLVDLIGLEMGLSFPKSLLRILLRGNERLIQARFLHVIAIRNLSRVPEPAFIRSARRPLSFS